jgi:hypothetical protein
MPTRKTTSRTTKPDLSPLQILIHFATPVSVLVGAIIIAIAMPRSSDTPWPVAEADVERQVEQCLQMGTPLTGDAAATWRDGLRDVEIRRVSYRPQRDLYVVTAMVRFKSGSTKLVRSVLKFNVVSACYLANEVVGDKRLTLRVYE